MHREEGGAAGVALAARVWACCTYCDTYGMLHTQRCGVCKSVRRQQSSKHAQGVLRGRDNATKRARKVMPKHSRPNQPPHGGLSPRLGPSLAELNMPYTGASRLSPSLPQTKMHASLLIHMLHS